MTGEDPEDVAPELEFAGPSAVEGDPAEVLPELEERLEYLESVWPTIDEGDPQRGVVALEIVALRNVVGELEGVV